jgi:activator of 2-hydroxyglutaryl-CoA dehydratase
MCAVFAESEVVSLHSKRKERHDIVHGLKIRLQARHKYGGEAGGRRPVVMTGGVARNRGSCDALTEALHENVLVPDRPEMCGALGAACFALDMGI